MAYGLENRLADLVSPLVAYKKREKYDPGALNRQFTQNDRSSTAKKDQNKLDFSEDSMDSDEELNHQFLRNSPLDQNKGPSNKQDPIIEENQSVFSREKSKSSVANLQRNFQHQEDIDSDELKTDG